jgi:hypothetical protein
MTELPADTSTAALFQAVERGDGNPWYKCRATGCTMNYAPKQVFEDRMIAHCLCMPKTGIAKCTGTQFFVFDGVEEVRCGRLAITKLLRPRFDARQQTQKRKAEASAQESAMRSGARQRSAQLDDLANSRGLWLRVLRPSLCTASFPVLVRVPGVPVPRRGPPSEAPLRADPTVLELIFNAEGDVAETIHRR